MIRSRLLICALLVRRGLRHGSMFRGSEIKVSRTADHCCTSTS